jgi:ATP phosphoribosyltransferase
VYNVDGQEWYAVSLVVSQGKIPEVVEHLRQVGASEISTSHVGFMYKERCYAYESLLSKLET